MVTVCKKWRLSYTEARRLVDINNGGNNDDEREDERAYLPSYAAIGPASNLYEVCDDSNPSLYQDYAIHPDYGVDEDVSNKQCLDQQSGDQLHSYWQTLYHDIEHSLREQVSVEVNRFHSNIQQVISEQFNNSTQCAGMIGEQQVHLDREDHNGENSLLSASQGGESCSESYSTYVTCHDNNSNCDTEESNQLMTTYYSQSQQSIDSQIDQTLVRLQTYALFISNVLRRSEYSTGSSSS